MRVLVFNCGSSSLKFDVLNVASSGTTTRIARGAIERIGGQAEAWLQAAGGKHERATESSDYDGAVRAAVDMLAEAGLTDGLDAVAHRVVHGGPRFRDAVLIDEDVTTAIEQVSELAPLHNRPALEAIRASRSVFGDSKPMVAAFDTSFFADLPDVAREYALAKELRERLQIRRYGFHGLAHRYMVERYRELRPDVESPRLITLQLGSGCSATASRNGLPLDTSMGFTPLEGLIMGTRSGDLDPMLPLLMVTKAGMTVDEVEALLHTKSGLLGLSGRSNDMRDLLEAAAEGDAGADFAVRAFCYRVRKYIGAYMAVLGGADAVVFGGGIGERSPDVRSAICEPFAWLGLDLDAARNASPGDDDAFVSTLGSRVEALVVHVDEASVIARDAVRVLGGGG